MKSFLKGIIGDSFRILTKMLVVLTFLSLFFLFAMFWAFFIRGEPLYSLVCAGGMLVMLKVNEAL